MLNEQTFRNTITALATRYPAVKLVYLFGSRARGDAGPTSDIDVAIQLDPCDTKQAHAIRIAFLTELNRALRRDDVDIVVLNQTASPEFKYAIIAEGKLLYEVEPYKLLVEPRILHEYFDFQSTLRRYDLTRA